jgi:type IV pilus biogenesis protein CpaD/CtpE
MNAKTSDRVSSLAGRYGDITATELLVRCKAGQSEEIAADIRSMAASLRRQDEHKGLRGKLKLVFGR